MAPRDPGGEHDRGDTVRLELSGELKIAYDWIVYFQETEGRGTTVRELHVGTGIQTGTTSIYCRALVDLGLVERREVKKESGYIALEIVPTDANPYEEG